MLFKLPDISSGEIDVENGRHVLKGGPTPEDIEKFERWRKGVERMQSEIEGEFSCYRAPKASV